MSTIDIIILVPVVIGAFFGYRKGLLIEIISFAALIVAIFLGYKLIDFGAVFLAQYLEGMLFLLPYLSFFLIFLLVFIGLKLTGKIVKYIIDLTLLGSLDNIAGMIFGAIKWTFIVGTLLHLEQYVHVIPESIKEGAQIYPIIMKFSFAASQIFLEKIKIIQEMNGN